MAINSRQGQLPHLEWLDLQGNGVFAECVVMKRESTGVQGEDNIYFFQVNSLDRVDKKRLGQILTGRLASQLPCYDLMFQTTLNNGVNALEYFNQLVRVISANGQIYSPRTGLVGTGQVSGRMDTRTAEERATAEIERAAVAARTQQIKDSI